MNTVLKSVVSIVGTAAVVIWFAGCTHTIKFEDTFKFQNISSVVDSTEIPDDDIPDDDIFPGQKPDWQDPCTTLNDTDCDGFTDSLEAVGFTTTGSNPKYYPRCDSGPREDCVDPNSRDLFVILERASGSLIPETSASFKPFELISKSKAARGLSIAVHELSVSAGEIASSRQVTLESSQKAVRVDENNTRNDIGSDCRGSTVNVPLGWTSTPGWGLPNDGLFSTVNTLNIVAYIDHYCENVTGECKDDDEDIVGESGECDPDGGVTLSELDALDRHFIKYILAHEVSHNLQMIYKPTKDGYHHPAGDGTVMERSVGSALIGTDYVFTIPEHYEQDYCQKGARIVVED